MLLNVIGGQNGLTAPLSQFFLTVSEALARSYLSAWLHAEGTPIAYESEGSVSP